MPFQESQASLNTGRHKKTIHRHGKVKMTAYNVYFQTRRGGKLTEHRLGLFCPGCGFQPGPTAREMRRQGTDAAVRSLRG